MLVRVVVLVWEVVSDDEGLRMDLKRRARDSKVMLRESCDELVTSGLDDMRPLSLAPGGCGAAAVEAIASC